MVGLLAFAVAAASLPHVTPRDLVETAAIRDVAVSPDGRRVAYRVVRASLADNIDRAAWFVTPVDGATPPVQIADGGEAPVNFAGELDAQPAIWSPDSGSIYFRAMIGGGVQIWRAGASMAARQMTHEPGDVVDLALEPGARSLAYRVGAPRAAIDAAQQAVYDDGLRIDATTDIAQPVVGGVVAGGRRRMMRFTGNWFTRAPLLADAPMRDVRLDLATGTLAPLTGPSILGDATAPGATRIRNALGDEVSVDWTDGARQPVIRSRDGRTLRCTAALCLSRQVRDVLWSGDGKTVVLVAGAEGGRSLVATWDPVTTRVNRVASTTQDLESCAIARDALVCAASAALSPAALARVDLASGALSTIDDPNAGLRVRITAQARRLDWQAGGAAFSGILVENGQRKAAAPVVISYYRCRRFLRGLAGDDLPVLSLVAAGISVLCIEETKRDAPPDRNADYVLARTGIAAIVAQLAREGAIDRARVGMHGFSFGNEVALHVAAETDLLSALSLDSAHIEPGYYWMYTLPGRDVAAMLKRWWHIGSPDDDPAGWARVSPVHMIDRLRAPMLMQLPEYEARLVTEFYSRALQAGKPVELYAFADEPHIKAQPRHRLAAMTRNLDWFRYWWLGAREPGKAAQYAGWDALRAQRDRLRADPAHP